MPSARSPRRGVGVRVRLREELERFLGDLAAAGHLAPGAGEPAALAEGYLRRCQDEVGARSGTR